jgi:hypothetical protein
MSYKVSIFYNPYWNYGNKKPVVCRMVDEQIFIEVGKRWVEMMMDPGKKTILYRNPPPGMEKKSAR